MWWKSDFNNESSIFGVISGLLTPVAPVARRKIGNKIRERFQIQFFKSFPKIHKLIILKQVSKCMLDHFLAPRSSNLLMSKCFCKRLWFSLLLQHCFLLCFSWSTSPNYPLLQCSCSIFLFLNVIAAFLWLSPLLSSGSHCFHSWYICFCFPHDIAIGSMMHLALLSNRYPQDRQPGQELKK